MWHGLVTCVAKLLLASRCRKLPIQMSPSILSDPVVTELSHHREGRGGGG